MELKTTLVSHIFNEEYLIPFWLNHHKTMFDQIIIIDYNSTDKSIEICKNICPDCKIIKTRNNCFDAHKVDQEVMDIENNIDGVKIVLNTTEFLFCEKPIKYLFSDNKIKGYNIKCLSPYSLNIYNVNNINELFKNLLNNDIVYHYDRHIRFIHNFQNGNYDVGRHSSKNISIPTDDMFIVWFGFYPMNNDLLKRKLQIHQNMPQHDKNAGNGIQHLWDRDKMLDVNYKKAKSGLPLKDINSSLYKLLSMYKY